MSNFLEEIREKVPEKCQARRCKKEGCSLTNTQLQSTPFIVDMDCDELPVPPDQKRCDYILFSNEGGHNWMVPIEMKKGSVDPGEVQKQLQAGTNFAASTLLSPDVAIKFKPLAVHKRKRLKRFVYQEFKKSQYRIRFQAGKHEIELCRSGTSLASVLT